MPVAEPSHSANPPRTEVHTNGTSPEVSMPQKSGIAGTATAMLTVPHVLATETGGNPTAYVAKTSQDNLNKLNSSLQPVPLQPKLEPSPYVPAQFPYGVLNASQNQALLLSFQQQQQQFFSGFPAPLNQPTGMGGAYWNSFSVIGSSRIEPFPERLHRLLREVETMGRTDVISWVHEGRGFEIHKSEDFFRDIVPHYFKQSKLASFKRQLGLYGFQLYTHKHSKGGSGTVKGYYAHKDFLKDMPELCRRMRRHNQKGTATFGKGKVEGKVDTSKDVQAS